MVSKKRLVVRVLASHGAPRFALLALATRSERGEQEITEETEASRSSVVSVCSCSRFVGVRRDAALCCPITLVGGDSRPSFVGCVATHRLDPARRTWCVATRPTRASSWSRKNGSSLKFRLRSGHLALRCLRLHTIGRSEQETTKETEAGRNSVVSVCSRSKFVFSGMLRQCD